MLTASAFEDDHRIVIASGIDEYLRKPLEEDALFSAIERLLQIHLLRAPQPGTQGNWAMVAGAADEIVAWDALSPRQCLVLREAVEELNRTKLNPVVAELEATQPALARQITEMADRFRYKELWEKLELLKY